MCYHTVYQGMLNVSVSKVRQSHLHNARHAVLLFKMTEIGLVDGRKKNTKNNNFLQYFPRFTAFRHMIPYGASCMGEFFFNPKIFHILREFYQPERVWVCVCVLVWMCECTCANILCEKLTNKKPTHKRDFKSMGHGGSWLWYLKRLIRC